VRDYAQMFGYLEGRLPVAARRELVTELKVADLDGLLGEAGRATLDALEESLPEEVDPR